MNSCQLHTNVLRLDLIHRILKVANAASVAKILETSRLGLVDRRVVDFGSLSGLDT